MPSASDRPLPPPPAVPDPLPDAMPMSGGLIPGLLLIGLALIAFVAPFTAGGLLLFVIGLVLAFAGAIEIARAFHARGASGSSLHLGLGVALLLAGIMITIAPAPGSAYLTYLLAGLFLVLAVLRAGRALTTHPRSRQVWYAVLAAAALALFAAVVSGLAVRNAVSVGVLIGLDLLLMGIAAVSLAAAPRPGVRSAERRDDLVRGEPARVG